MTPTATTPLDTSVELCGFVAGAPVGGPLALEVGGAEDGIAVDDAACAMRRKVEDWTMVHCNMMIH